MLDEKRSVLNLLLAAGLVMSCAGAARAEPQADGGGLGLPSPAVSEIATPMIASGSRYQATQNGSDIQFMINVQVWGQVYQPGLYAVPDDTGIVGLLSYAGGPTENASLEDVRLIHVDGDESPSAIDLKAFIKSGKLAANATLQPGDVLLVPANRSHQVIRFTNVLTFVTLAANVIILAARN